MFHDEETRAITGGAFLNAGVPNGRVPTDLIEPDFPGIREKNRENSKIRPILEELGDSRQKYLVKSAGYRRFPAFTKNRQKAREEQDRSRDLQGALIKSVEFLYACLASREHDLFSLSICR